VDLVAKLTSLGSELRQLKGRVDEMAAEALSTKDNHLGRHGPSYDGGGPTVPPCRRRRIHEPTPPRVLLPFQQIQCC
jgi:hypothetical protein